MNRRFFLKSIAAGAAAAATGCSFTEIAATAPEAKSFIRFTGIRMVAGETYTASLWTMVNGEHVRLVQSMVAAPGQDSVQFDFAEKDVQVWDPQVIPESHDHMWPTNPKDLTGMVLSMLTVRFGRPC